jgi:hypothetical protein
MATGPGSAHRSRLRGDKNGLVSLEKQPWPSSREGKRREGQ